MVSSYYFHQMAGFLKDPGTFDEFMDTFLEGKGQRLLNIFRTRSCLSLLPVSEQLSIAFILSVLSAVLFGKWTDHVKSWRHTELGDRILYITYEEMVQVTYSYLKAKGAGSL